MINILEMESSKGWGGQEKRTVRVVNNLPEDEYRVFWAVEENSTLYKNREEVNGEFFTFKLNKIYNLKTIYFLCKFIKKNKIDIISTHSGKDSWIGNIVGLLTNTSVIRVRHLILPIKGPYSYNLTTKVVTVSNQVKEYLSSMGVHDNKLVNIYTGIDTNKFSPNKNYDLRTELNLSSSILLVGVVAVLRDAKRHMALIKAFSKIKNIDVKLVIVGEGPMKERIENCIKENNVENRVIMLGHRNDVENLLPNFDLFCLASRHEALGTSLLEAQSCGVPVLGSNVGGIPEALEDGKTGYLFDDFKMLEKQLKELLEDNIKRENFSKNAREFILKCFSVEKMMEDTTKLYKELVDKL
ncbi:glycosyltransferase family 4 protein [Arcobacter sp. KX21116]|uniref:glycosyltransferase family 4 protein n=1 Tax=Arcobacter iocasae TaxID=2906515 RepID=UPI0035D48ABD